MCKTVLNEVYSRFKGKCVYCKKKVSRKDATKDHFVPTDLGGSNFRDNLVLSCYPCNTKKTNTPPLKFLRQEKLDYSAPRFARAIKYMILSTLQVVNSETIHITIHKTLPQDSRNSVRVKPSKTQQHMIKKFGSKCSVCDRWVNACSVHAVVVVSKKNGGKADNPDNYTPMCHICFTDIQKRNMHTMQYLEFRRVPLEERKFHKIVSYARKIKFSKVNS